MTLRFPCALWLPGTEQWERWINSTGELKQQVCKSQGCSLKNESWKPIVNFIVIKSHHLPEHCISQNLEGNNVFGTSPWGALKLLKGGRKLISWCWNISKRKLLFVLAKWREIRALRSARANQREEIPGVYLEKRNHKISKMTKYEHW